MMESWSKNRASDEAHNSEGFLYICYQAVYIIVSAHNMTLSCLGFTCGFLYEVI